MANHESQVVGANSGRPAKRWMYQRDVGADDEARERSDRLSRLSHGLIRMETLRMSTVRLEIRGRDFCVRTIHGVQ